ncbi:hypothetical protein CPB84DRAFT_1770722 [Gymnopilus junonius]|uniref:Uncharacterized protein n=1 Tax=Gymnopilus junonius TaxID=109634 RepID=A0A9P5NUR6_GYMJU|nr:hypothetical protein CPB84DRAFT_1770722 [Gymnopilus junonius]
MASLPPRPETTPKPLRDDRRPTVDERDRDRRSSQSITASRLRPNDRIPEHERSYVPRKSDSYVPGGYDSRRESDRRDYDDRDRRRTYGRERNRDYDRSRSPRRRSPDRHPYDRDRAYRRSPSPYRRSGFSRRDSRSPPRYRRRSRTPPRLRPRSRSRSARRPSPIRLGNHSIAPSPRERSPYRRSGHRTRSRSSDKRPSKSDISPNKSSPAPSAPQKVEQVAEQKARANTPIVVEENASRGTASSEGKRHEETTKIPLSDKTESPLTTATQVEPTTKLVKEEKEEKVKLEMSEHPVSPPVENKKVEDVENMKMDVVESPSVPSLSPAAPSLPTQPSIKSSSLGNEPQRGPTHIAQAQSNWQYPLKVTRSPPRAPRGHRLAGHQTSHSLPPREPRRSYGLPNIPKYERPKQLTEIEQELSKYETLRRNYASNHLAEVKELRRALHELDMTTIDLRAAETRHRIADLQLEKAKTGTLGIEAVDVIEV